MSNVLAWKGLQLTRKYDSFLLNRYLIVVVLHFHVNKSIYQAPYLTREYGTRPFLKWDQAQDYNADMPGGYQNASNPVGILFINLASLKRIKAFGDGPLRLLTVRCNCWAPMSSSLDRQITTYSKTSLNQTTSPNAHRGENCPGSIQPLLSK